MEVVVETCESGCLRVSFVAAVAPGVTVTKDGTSVPVRVTFHKA